MAVDLGDELNPNQDDALKCKGKERMVIVGKRINIGTNIQFPKD